MHNYSHKQVCKTKRRSEHRGNLISIVVFPGDSSKMPYATFVSSSTNVNGCIANIANTVFDVSVDKLAIETSRRENSGLEGEIKIVFVKREFSRTDSKPNARAACLLTEKRTLTKIKQESCAVLGDAVIIHVLPEVLGDFTYFDYKARYGIFSCFAPPGLPGAMCFVYPDTPEGEKAAGLNGRAIRNTINGLDFESSMNDLSDLAKDLYSNGASTSFTRHLRRTTESKAKIARKENMYKD